MEWDRAKNQILVFFVLLNVVLAAFMLSERRRYTVTGEHEAMIRNVLAQNNITLDTDMIRRFPPMRALLMSGYYYDEDALLQIFFADSHVPERIEHAWGVEFTHGDVELVIANGYVSFFDPNGLGGTPQAFISRHFPDFVHDERFLPYDNEGEVVFRQVYRGYVIYSNSIHFLVTDAGITEVVMRFGIIQGWDGPERPIFAPDEALLTFMQSVQAFTRDPVTIWYIDIVYFIEFDHASHEPGTVQHAMPFYRIFTHEFDIPFLINAYLNFSIDV